MDTLTALQNITKGQQVVYHKGVTPSVSNIALKTASKLCREGKVTLTQRKVTQYTNHLPNTFEYIAIGV